MTQSLEGLGGKLNGEMSPVGQYDSGNLRFINRNRIVSRACAQTHFLSNNAHPT